MLFKKRVVVAASVALLAVAVPACGSDDSTSGGSGTGASASGGGGDAIRLGFAQVGAESGWRTANTTSIQDSAKQAGIDLKFGVGDCVANHVSA